MNSLSPISTRLPVLFDTDNWLASDPCVPDVSLAERLGYKRPTDIRKLITRHAPTLEAMGSLRHGVAMITTGKGAKRDTQLK